MKKMVTGMTLVLFALSAGSALAQVASAKGSAAISNATLIESTEMTHSWDPVLSTIIQVPQQKELVFDVAMQCGLYTDTLVRSKGGERDTSVAEAAIEVRVKLQKILGQDAAGNLILGPEFFAHPGEVIYAKRAQTLMAKFQGIFQQCEQWVEVPDPYNGGTRQECASYSADTCLDVAPVDTNGDGVIDDYVTSVDVDCLDYEEVQLILDTINANAFNFVTADLEQGEYKVTVESQISSNTDWTNGGAAAKGLVGLGSLVVDEVRFIKGDAGNGL